MENVMKNKFTTVIFVFLIFTFGFIIPSFSLQDDKNIVTISPKAAVNLIAQRKGDTNFVIIDIRTPGEYKSGHLPDSILIDFYSTAFADKITKLDKAKTYLIYCRSGNRSSRSLELFRKLKFQKVYHMASGIIGWKSEKHELIK
jgi:rhodanese-related sulfurtransferase